MQVKLTKISYIGTLFKVRFVQDSGLFSVRFVQDSGLFSVRFVQDSGLFSGVKKVKKVGELFCLKIYILLAR